MIAIIIGIIIMLVLLVAAYYYYSMPATPVAPVAAPVVKTVFANNGTVSCETYCGGYQGGSWNNELPADWNGAKCVGTNRPSIDCNTAPGLTTGFKCDCTPSDTGWN